MEHARDLVLKLGQERPQHKLLEEPPKPGTRVRLVLADQAARHDLLDPLEEGERRPKEDRDIERVGGNEGLVRPVQAGGARASADGRGVGRGDDERRGGGRRGEAVGDETGNGSFDGAVERVFERPEELGRGLQIRVGELEDLLRAAVRGLAISPPHRPRSAGGMRQRARRGKSGRKTHLRPVPRPREPQHLVDAHDRVARRDRAGLVVGEVVVQEGADLRAWRDGGEGQRAEVKEDGGRWADGKERGGKGGKGRRGGKGGRGAKRRERGDAPPAAPASRRRGARTASCRCSF